MRSVLNTNEANIGTAILQNYERVQEIYETSLDSAGSAEKENEKYLESVQGHLDQLQAKWQSFGANLADSTALKVFIDLGGGLISVLDKLTDMFGSAGIAMLPFMAIMSKLGNKGIFKTVESFDKNTQSITSSISYGIFGKGPAAKAKADFNEDTFQQSLIKDKQAINDFNTMVTKQKMTVTEAISKMDDASEAAKRHCLENGRGTASVEEYEQAERKRLTAIENSQKGFKGLSTSMKTMALNMGAELAIMLALQAVMKIWQKADDEMGLTAATRLEKMENAVNNYNDALDQSKDNINTIKSLSDEFESLSRGVNDAGENVSLSTDEYDRYNEIVAELVSMNPELVQGYTNEGNAIIDRNKAIEAGIQAQKDYADAATATYLYSGDDIIKSNRDTVKDAQKGLSKNLTGGSTLGSRIDANSWIRDDILEEVLNRSVNAANLSVDDWRDIADHKEEIIAKTIEENKWNRRNIDDIQKIQELMAELTDADMKLADYDQSYAETLNWLKTYVTEADQLGQLAESSADSILGIVPESMQDGFLGALDTIASNTQLSASEMTAQAIDLANTLSSIFNGDTMQGLDTEVSIELDDGTHQIISYQEALQNAEKAKEAFDDSSRNTNQVDKYEKAIREEVLALNALADEWESIDPLVAESLRNQANAIDDYASEHIMTLAEAFNPLIDKFEEARNAKAEWDAAMEANPDYDAGVNSFAEVFDEVLDGDDNKGNGSRGFWTAAEQILGSKEIQELGADFDKVNAKLKYFKSFAKDSASAAGKFYKELLKHKDEIAAIGGDVTQNADGSISYDIDADEWAEVADILGMSEEFLMSILDMTRKWAAIDLSDGNSVITAIKDMDTTVSRNGKSFQLFKNIETEASAAGVATHVLYDKIEELKNVEVLNFNSADLANEAAAFVTAMDTKLGKSKKDGSFNLNAEAIIAQLHDMGASATEIRDVFDSWALDPDKFNIKAAVKNVNEDYINETIAEWEDGLQADTDPFTKLSDSADKFAQSINDLIIALGGLPTDYKIETNADEISANLKELAENSNLSTAGAKELKDSVSDSVALAEAEILKYEQLLKSDKLTNNQKVKLEADIEAAETELNRFKQILEDLQDGELNNFTFNADTGEFEEKSNIIQEEIEETPTFWQTIFNGEPGNVDTVSKRVQGMVGSVDTSPMVKFTAAILPSFDTIINKVKEKISSVLSLTNPAGGSKTGRFAWLTGGSQETVAKGTPHSAYYRPTRSYPSMAKGGRLGPNGNGGLTLTGELGTELVWIPSESRSFLVGQYGPEMVNLPGDAVVYPAEQTRKILGDTVSPGRLRFGTGSMAKGNIQLGSAGTGALKAEYVNAANNNKSSKLTKSDYDKELAKLDHKLEMGYITEVKYYNKLVELFNKYKTVLDDSTEDYREALQKKREASINAYEHEKDILDSKLDRELISEATYYDKLLKLGKKYYTADGKIRKGYEDEWRQWREDLRDAGTDAYEAEQEALNDKLSNDKINTRKYYQESLALIKKYNPKEKAEKKQEIQDAIGEEWSREVDKIDQKLSDAKLGLVDNYDATDALKALEQQKTYILNTIKLYPELEDEAEESLRAIAESVQELNEELKDDLNEFIELVEEMIRQEAEDYIDSLEKQADAFDELIDKRKEMLQLAEDEAAFYEEIEDGNREIAKIQQEIDALSRDDSRAARARVAELEEEKAQLMRDQNATVRSETVDQATALLDKQAEVYRDMMDNAIQVVEDWLNNKSAVIEVVIDAIENRDENDLYNRLIQYNGEFGDALKDTVDKAWGDINLLTEKYGSDVDSILQILNKGIDINLTGEYIKSSETDYEPPTHHSGLASGFTGDGYSAQQNEVWRLLTDDELVLNKADQFRIGRNMEILESIKSSYANLNKSIDIPISSVSPNIEIVIDAPITIQGNATADVINQLDKFTDKIANTTFDRLNEALRRNGMFTSAATNARKSN